MSRILRRPLFRGGSIDSRGTGITSGLTEEPRVRKQIGGAFTGRELMGLNQIYQTVPNLQLNPKSIYTPGTMGGSLDSLFKTMQDPERYNLLGAESLISDTANLSDFYKSQDEDKQFEPIASISDDVPIVEKRNEEISEGSIPIPNKETKTDDEGDINRENNLIPKPKPKDTGISDLEKDDTEINLEDIFAERIKRAKRGDIADILLGASEGFLEEGTLMGGAKGAVRAGRAPSRTEQAKQSQENILLQKAFAESKSKAEFEQAIKLLGIKGEQAERLAEKYAELGIKGGKSTDFLSALTIINDPNASQDAKNAAKVKLGLPVSVAAELSKKDLPTKNDAITAASNVYGKEFKGEIDMSNLTPGQNINPGVYIDTEQRRVVFIDQDGNVSDEGY